MIAWKCDICGTDTFINPRTEPAYQDAERKVPKTTVLKQQDPSGIVREVQVQAYNDLDPRAYLVRLAVSHENVQRDFCKKCLDEKVKPVLVPLWDLLAGLKSQ